MQTFTSLSYKNVCKLMEDASYNDLDHIELYYFVVSSSPNDLKIIRPSVCRVSLDRIHRSELNFHYLTPIKNWSKTYSYTFKKSGYYFTTKQEAEDVFKIKIKNVKEGFTQQLKSVSIALDTLKAY